MPRSHPNPWDPPRHPAQPSERASAPSTTLGPTTSPYIQHLAQPSQLQGTTQVIYPLERASAPSTTLGPTTSPYIRHPA
ncbi:uncharacterized protein THITE_2085223 [Thermothielavioides terrestris NRRL 8126]|uniref:Uncharacterized protein n=1 Tax=Thermothielavioides terrestris (strain ATCC 38088 / NRRL 8126) TaxID=578455 RepID=G2QUF6_THETT|nr:uncharacterized protein THITE_2085223 [Thermothielavioides terrestris NRRL 8126]AEO63708.1 hypothetical protein THITE_2085223 [Thermothielavioides terrestris NRRL 8126]